MDIKEQILDILSNVIHPEYKDNIVSLGMVEDIVIEDDSIKFNLMLKRTKDPLSGSVRKVAISSIEQSLPEYKNRVTVITKEPSPKPRKEKQPATEFVGGKIKNIIAVSSAKGGVGKSTVASSLAISLAKRGFKTALLDADIYGPSAAVMFGIEGYTPDIEVVDGDVELIIPAEKYGVKVMSIGFFVGDKDALIWRGPMATNALRQLISQTKWEDLDFLIVDMPPGTGDIHLTLISELKITGSIIVSTPQNIALADVVRGISMFRSESINIPILGIVENMAWFTPEELPDNKYYIFGEGGARELAKREEIPLLAEIPLIMSIREGGDSGEPAVISNEVIKECYNNIVDNIIEK